LQAIYGGVFAVNVVADFGFGHGAAHGWGGVSEGVATEVDWGFHGGLFVGDGL
jgi:hypothetical protein